jgi:hypothetical protein
VNEIAIKWNEVLEVRKSPSQVLETINKTSEKDKQGFIV